MKEYNLSISCRKGIVLTVCALFAVMLLAGCTSEPPKTAAPSATPQAVTQLETPGVEEVSAGDAAAGLEYMENSCTVCHSVPARNNIKPFDRVTAREFLAGHMITSSDADLDNMIAYFFD